MASRFEGQIGADAEGFVITQVGPAGRRSALDDGAGEPLSEGLAAAGFEEVQVLALTPTTGTRRGPGEVRSLDLNVPVGPDETAVLLLEDADGGLAWRLPEEDSGGSGQRRSLAGGTARFNIVFSDEGDQPERRGLVLDWALEKLLEPVRVRVLRFVAHQAIDLAVGRIEGNLVPGPVVVAGPDPSTWKAGAIAAANARLGQRTRRILLLIHGTFSSTAGSFGALAGAAWLEDYDLVLGFDHRTLGETPDKNAADIAAALEALDIPADATIDAIAFSRGGLVCRVLIEELLKGSPVGGLFRNVVFVGCTNGGTLLAEPDNWKALLDIYTNVLVFGARFGLTALGAGAATPFVTAAIKTMGGFAQIVSQVAITERYVPGLAAMEPDGVLVQRLNRVLFDRGDMTYRTVATNFQPVAEGGLGSRAAFAAINRIADRLYGVDNDLVVPTKAMTQFGPGADATEATADMRLADTSGIYHTVYFTAQEVREKIGEWLSPPRERRSAPERYDPPPRSGAAGILSTDEPEAVRGYRERTRRSGKAGLETAAKAAAPEDEAVIERYIGAEMTPFPRLEAPVNLYVTVSPDPVVVADHPAAAVADRALRLERNRKLKVEAVALSNCEIVGPREHEVDLSAEDDEVVLKFRVRGLSAGAAEVAVEARQNNATLAALTLQPVFVQGEPTPLKASLAMAAPPPSSGGRVVLRIYEFSGPGMTRVQFNLTSDDPEIADLEMLMIDGQFSMRDYATSVLADVEKAWNLRDTTDQGTIYRSFVERLQSDALMRTKQLVPDPIRRSLWKHRDRIKAIQVISNEPYIPWELMYLSDPERQETGGWFFAERGLTRWLHNAPIGRHRRPFNEGELRYVIPDYQGGRALNGAAEEQKMLKDTFCGFEPIDPTSTKVREYLKNAGNCALLHFACHGQTQQATVLSSDLLMRDQVNAAGRAISDPLTWQDVAANADFGPDGGPLVFLNACQTGATGAGISGVAGFASSFLRPESKRGAAAFIGALWSIDDQLAGIFAATVYEQLKEGAPLDEAVAEARKQCQSGNDFTWLAYTVYGG